MGGHPRDPTWLIHEVFYIGSGVTLHERVNILRCRASSLTCLTNSYSEGKVEIREFVVSFHRVRDIFRHCSISLLSRSKRQAKGKAQETKRPQHAPPYVRRKMEDARK